MMKVDCNKVWLACLKVGDKVAVHMRDEAVYGTVTGTTKTMVKVGNHQRFRKSDGRLVGGDIWSRCLIGKVTDDVRKSVYDRGIIYKYRHINDKLLPIHVMAKIVAMVAEYRKES